MTGRMVVTGADGFIGAVLGRELQARGHTFDAVSRTGAHGLTLTRDQGWRERLKGSDAVFHLAARAHVTREHAADPLQEFRTTNVDGASIVARAAAEAGVRRFVFLSSIGVTGNSSERPVTEDHPAAPIDAYAISKWEAEQCLRSIERETGLDVVIIRPPLVYGPGVKGNFLRLLKLIAAGVPLPVAGIHNRRSFVGVHNLCSLLMSAAVCPEARGQLFVAADGEDTSTEAVIRLMAHAMGRRAHVWPVPGPMMVALTKLAGKQKEWEKLTCSLPVDATRARSTLQWRPHVSLEAGIAEMVSVFKQAQSLR